MKLPEQHPRAADGGCEIYGFLIDHPDGKLLVDTGVADDNEQINGLYEPQVVPLVAALNEVGTDEREIAGLINTHLHFDHCGQNRALPKVPVWVQSKELQASLEAGYTVPEWAHLEPERRREVQGDTRIAEGVWLISTPGHTPGHQSVLVEADRQHRFLIVGQCCYSADEFRAGDVLPADMHDEVDLEVGRQSLARLRSLRPLVAYFSHDASVLRAGV